MRVFVNDEEKDGMIVIFHVFPKNTKNVFIKGYLDVDMTEEIGNRIYYIDKNGNELEQIPPNPYEKHSLEWQAYEYVASVFKITDDFMELLEECCGLEHYSLDSYDLEIEDMYW